MGTLPPKIRLDEGGHDSSASSILDDAEVTPHDNDDDDRGRRRTRDVVSEESITPRARPFRLRAGDRDDGGATSAKGNQSGSNRLFSVTSAALTRVKGMSIRSGSDGRVLNPRSITLASTLFSPSRKNGGNGDHAFKGVEKISKKDSSSNSERDVSSDSSGPLLFEEIDGQGDRATAGDGGRRGGGGIGSNKSNKQKLSVLFDDDESEAENVSEGRGTMSTNSDGGGQENTPTPRSQWASTLMASTLAREKSTGKTTVRGRVGLLPRPRDARNKVNRRFPEAGGVHRCTCL